MYDTGDFVLVYWPEERQTSIVSAKNVVDPGPPSIGCECKMKAGKDLFTGEVIGIG